jgi:hypothetical protein
VMISCSIYFHLCRKENVPRSGTLKMRIVSRLRNRINPGASDVDSNHITIILPIGQTCRVTCK